MCERFIDLCRSRNIAITVADTAGRWPFMEDVTADFVYVRLHGSQQLYVSGYRDEEIAWWSERARSWLGGRQPNDATTVRSRKPRRRKRDVFIYFDNDAKVHAPFDAMRLAAALGSSYEAACSAEAAALVTQRGGRS